VGVEVLEPAQARPFASAPAEAALDLAAVRGQPLARRALEIAAAGGHHLLFIGPPGSGKTLLSRCLPSILPPLSRPETLLVTRIHSAAGLRTDAVMAGDRPFRAPHATVSTAGLVGGGALPRPGEISLAHHGVLFLDELPEFRRDALESLRQPLEEGVIWIARVGARLTFPARFGLVAAMNPCKCGHLGDDRHECLCTPAEVERYRNRVSGPLLDRIDLHVEVPAVTIEEMKGEGGEASAAVAARVLEARERQRFRFGKKAVTAVNAELDEAMLRRHCRLDSGAESLLDKAFERLGLSARAVTRLLKVSRTIADLRGAETIGAQDVAEAIQYRALDRRAVA
jgi:magnesium chelatase family protein